jgi:hypothetical protein
MRLAIVLALFAASCGQNMPEGPEEMPPMAPDGVVGCLGPVPAPAPGSTLAFLAAPGEVLTYSVQAASGCWTLLDRDPAGGAGGIAADPTRRFLFVNGRVAERVTGIHAFRIDAARGALEPAGATPVASAGAFFPPGPVVATATDVFAIGRPSGIGSHGDFWRFEIDTGRGAVSWRDDWLEAKEAWFLALWGSGSVLYMGTESTDPSGVFVRAVRVGPFGSLSRIADVDTDYGVGVADPAGTFLWVANEYVDGKVFGVLEAYRPSSSGALAPAGSAPWHRGVPAAHPSGRLLFALDGPQLQSFAVDPVSGAPRLVSSAVLPLEGFARVAADPGGEFVYAATADAVYSVRTDAAGRLRALGRVADRGGLLAMVPVP